MIASNGPLALIAGEQCVELRRRAGGCLLLRIVGEVERQAARSGVAVADALAIASRSGLEAALQTEAPVKAEATAPAGRPAGCRPTPSAVRPRGAACVRRSSRTQRGRFGPIEYAAQVDLQALQDLELADAGGARQRLGDYFAQRPTVLVFLRHFG